MPQTEEIVGFYSIIRMRLTVHSYLFYSLYVLNGSILMEINQAHSVLEAINSQGGVYMLGRFLPIWAVVIVEFVFAFGLECLIGSPCSFKLACRIFDPKNTHPVIFETAIICATVGIMCPSMSFIAALLYYPYYEGFNLITILADWLSWYASIFRLRFSRSFSSFNL